MMGRLNFLLCALSALAALSQAADRDVIVFRVFSENCWQMYPNRLTGNSKRVPSVKSLDLCKKFCIAKSKHVEGKKKSCTAIEWDIPSKTCFAVIGKADRPKGKPGRYHYQRTNCKKTFESVKISEIKSSGERKVLKFSALGQDWLVNLRKNTAVVGKGAEFNLATRSGKTRAGNLGPGKDCFWVGTAESGEQEFGVAAFTICGDRFRGYINTPINDYEVNPYSREEKKRTLRDVIEDLDKAYYSDLYNRHLDMIKAEKRNKYLSVLQKRGDPKVAFGVELKPLLPPPGRTTYYELNLIMDGSYFREFKKVSGLTKYKDGLFYLAEITNFMQAWYLAPSFGMRVWLVVKRATLVEGAIPINKRNRAEDELNAVCRWQANAFKGDWDGTIFMTGDGTITNEHGLAIPFSACTQKHSHCGSVPTNGISLAASVRTYAHEAAHTLGMLDLYTPGSPFYTMCYHGLMRDGASSNTWTRCSVQMYERWLNVKSKTCVLRENTPGIPDDVKLPLVPIDAAFRAQAKMSSTYKGQDLLYGAWKAVDGSYGGEPVDVEGNFAANKDPKLHSCALSNKEKNPYLLVDLPAEYVKNPVFSINIINYWEKANRLRNFEIRVGNNKDFTKNPLCYKHKGDLPVRLRGSMWSAKCQGQISGRYVSIQIIGEKEQMAICELQVLQEIQPKDFKSPFTCSDDEANCLGWIRRGCSRYMKKCAYTCGACKRKPYAPPNKYPALSDAKLQCDDQDGFVCGAYNAAKLCGTRRAILTCPKTCGKCGAVKPPAPPGPEPEPKFDPNCVDKAMACQSWVKKNPDTCKKAHLASMCKSTCKKC